MKRKNHRLAKLRANALFANLLPSIPAQFFESLESRQLLSATYSVAGLPNNPTGQVGAFNDAGQVAGANGDVGFLYSNGSLTTFSASTDANLTVTAMNATGQIVGTAGNDAFLYSGGTVTLLTMPAGTVSATPVAINGAGTVAGTYSPSANVLHGFTYSNGTFTDIGTLGGTDSTVTGMNNSGQAVGYSNVVNGDTHAFIYSAGAITDIDPSGGNLSSATAINDAGQIIGLDRTSAFIYSAGTITHISFAGADATQADVINASGEVAGIAVNASTQQDELFTYKDGVMTDAGNISGSSLIVTGINASGVVIGTSTDASSFVTSPFVYVGGAIQTLNYDQGSLAPVQQQVGTTSEPLQDADFINTSGQIVADVPDNLGAGRLDIYVLTPATSGSISGTVFEDTNADGVQQSGEAGISGLTVYDDETNAGFPQIGDPQAITDANGNYTLTNVPPGPAIIRFAATTSNTTQSIQSLSLASGQTVTNINFATHPIAHFNITDLGQLGGNATTATAINDSGQIVGYSFDGTNYDPFLYTVSTGIYTDLTSVLGQNAEINSINNHGAMVGTILTGNVDSTGAPLTNAFVYSNGTLTILPLPMGTDSAAAMGINDSGQIVALVNSVPTSNGLFNVDITEGFIYSAATGQVVAEVPQGHTDVGALAINNTGQVFENAYVPPQGETPGSGGNFLYSGGQLQPITAATVAAGPWFGNPIPATLGNTILGYSNIGGSPLNVGAFGPDNDLAPSFYTNSQFVDLNDALPTGSGWFLSFADNIDSTTGTIVGSGVNPNGNIDAYLLTPATQAAPASISGTVFNDANSNGTQDSGELGVAGVTVYIDVNNTGSFVQGDPVAVTDANGNYTLGGLTAGPYTIREVVPNGDTQTAPASNGGISVTVAAGQNATQDNFGVAAVVQQAASISGTVFNDANGNGVKDSGEAGVSGVQVYIDVNNTGSFVAGDPSTVTGTGGTYTLGSLAAGQYVVRETVPTGNAQTLPAANAGISVTLTAGQTATGDNFGFAAVVQPTAAITGTVFNDANGNGVKDTGETGVLGVQVYIDVNNSGSFVSGDPSAVTNASGAYSITGLVAGHYVVRETIPAGDTQTSPATNGSISVTLAAGVNSTQDNFGLSVPVPAGPSISGTVFSDTNGDGVQDDGETGLAGVTVYEDPNYNHKVDPTEQHTVTDANGNYTFTNLPTDPEIIRIILPSGATQTAPTNGAGIFVGNHVTTALTGENFGVFTPVVIQPASVSGTVFNDINQDGVQQTGEGGVANVTVYVDLNNTGSFVPGDPTTMTDAQGNYTINGVPPGSHIVRAIVPSGDQQLFPAASAGYSVNLSSSQAVTGLNFALTVPQTTGNEDITGTVFNDLNHDGIQDNGEPGVAGVVVYQDPNYNHKIDAGEQSTITDANGHYEFNNPPADPEILRIILPNGTTQSLPTGGVGIYVGQNTGQTLANENFAIVASTGAATSTVSGTVFTDANGDGVQDNGETGVSGVSVYVDLQKTGSFVSGDPTAVTDGNGNYSITGLAPGSYTVREVLTAGNTQTTPANNAGISVTLAAGQIHASTNFGLNAPAVAPTGTISGIVFNDINGDQFQDNGEPGVAGVTVYIDVNNTGSFVTGDPSATTDANGNYTFPGLPAGQYVLREIVPAGDTQTVPLTNGGISINLAAGANAVQENFGLSLPVTPPGASISGTVFNDANHDGVQDNGELGIAGVTVYEDPNYNHKVDASEQHVVTDANGNYTFTNLPADPEIIRIVLPGGATQTAPANGIGIYVGKNITTAVTGINFGISTPTVGTGSITGTVYNDLNGDHVQDGAELAKVGATVYLDLNHSGVFNASDPTAVTDINGNYLFTGIAPGNYTVGLVTDPGFRQTFPLTGGINATVTSGGTVSATFGETNTAYVGGTLFNDKNGNDVQDAGEAGLSGWTVYLDLNNDGIHESSEPVAQTVTTSTGYWYFRAVAPGTYTIRAVSPSGWTITHAFTVTPTNGQMITTGAIGAKQG